MAPWGTYVTTPQVSHAAAQVCVRTQLRNEGADEVRAILTTAILDAAGIKVAEQQAEQMLVGGGCHEAVQTLTVSTPQRWSTTEPYLYQVVSEVWVGERLVDRSATPLGIRALEFTADNGFLLNGKALGRKDFKDNKSLHLEWQVPYAAGVLKAVGMKDGQTIIDEVRTAGEPAKLIVRPDRQHSASCSLESNCCQDPREVTLNDNHEY